MEIIPISELRGKKKDNPRQNDDYLPQFNFRMLLIGGSGSGKTTMIVNMLRNMTYDRLYVFAKDVDNPEDEYLFLQEMVRVIRDRREEAWQEKIGAMSEKQLLEFYKKIFKNVGKYKMGNDFDIKKFSTKQIIEFMQNYRPIPYMTDFLFEDNLDNVPHPKDIEMVYNLNSEQMEYPISIFIFDDMINETNQKMVEDCYIYGRKHGINSIYISHEYKDTPKKVKGSNANYIILYDATKEELVQLARKYRSGLEKDEFYDAFKRATKEQYNFLFIDMNASKYDKSRRFRRNFEIGSLFDENNNPINYEESDEAPIVQLLNTQKPARKKRSTHSNKNNARWI